MDTKYAFVGFLRALGFVVLTAILTFVGDTTNLTFLSPNIAALISAVALALEHAVESAKGKALFGAVRV